MNNPYERLSLKQVDRQTVAFKPLQYAMPDQGWIHYIRDALALSTGNLAKLLKITQPSVQHMEERERKKTITLETLEKTAHAMGCELVYGFVPKTSLEHFVQKNIQEIADKTLKDVHLTMSLEQQGLDAAALKEQKQLLQEQLTQKPLKALWRHL